MNDCNQDQTDDDAPLRDDVSDDAIEAAAVAPLPAALVCRATGRIFIVAPANNFYN